MIGDEVGKDSRASYNGLELARTSVVWEQYKGVRLRGMSPGGQNESYNKEFPNFIDADSQYLS